MNEESPPSVTSASSRSTNSSGSVKRVRAQKLGSWLRRREKLPPPLRRHDVEVATLDEISESDGDIIFEQYNNEAEEAENYSYIKAAPTLEQIAESGDGDIIFEIDSDDENDSLEDTLSIPQRAIKSDIEAPDPSEIIDGTAGKDEEEDEGRRPKSLWATALAVTAVVGLVAAKKVVEDSDDFDDFANFDNTFAGDGGGAAKAGADTGGAAKATGDGVVAKGSSDGIGGGGGKVAGNDGGGGAVGNDAGGAAGRAAGNDAGGSGAQPRQ